MRTGMVLKRKGKLRSVTVVGTKYWECGECDQRITPGQLHVKHELRNVAIFRTHYDCEMKTETGAAERIKTNIKNVCV